MYTRAPVIPFNTSGLDRRQELEIYLSASRWTQQRRQTGQGVTLPRPRNCTKAILDEGGVTCRRTGSDVTFLGLSYEGEAV
jgi:hypothetical protein